MVLIKLLFVTRRNFEVIKWGKRWIIDMFPLLKEPVFVSTFIVPTKQGKSETGAIILLFKSGDHINTKKYMGLKNC